MLSTILIFTSLVPFIFVQGQDCFIDDAQNTIGKCTPFPHCPYAIGNYRAGISPKICYETVVCCPTAQTISQIKCDEWRSYLSTPVNSFAAVDPLAEPFCTPLPLATESGFIVGGRDARQYEYPHAAALGYKSGKDNIHYACGGTIVSDEYILTAAHCINSELGKPIQVLVGDLTLNRQTSNFRHIAGIKNWIIHPKYKPPLRYNDIALIQLNETLEISRYLLPACLPFPGQNQSQVVEAIGWGTVGFGEPQSKNLLAVNLTSVGTKECEKFYVDTADSALRLPKGLDRSQMCAGDKTNKGKDTCNGDSGGPLTVNEVYRGKELRCMFRLIGITSFGSRLCGESSPGVYTRVLSYVPWIESIIFKNIH